MYNILNGNKYRVYIDGYQEIIGFELKEDNFQIFYMTQVYKRKNPSVYRYMKDIENKNIVIYTIKNHLMKVVT